MRWSAHISWLFAELPYLARPEAARRAGFTAIESAWPEQEQDREGLVAAAAAAGTSVVLLNAPAGDVDAGERGYANDPARREQAEQAFAGAAALAAAAGAPHVNVLAGRLLPGLPRRRQQAALVSALRAFASIGAEHGVEVVLEPINELDSPGFLAPTPDAVAELIAQVGDERIGMLLDVYHVACAGGDPLATVARHAELIRHVQVSSYPGRGAPGTGSLELPALLAALEEIGYQGAVGLEYLARDGTQASLRFLREPWAAAMLA